MVGAPAAVRPVRTRRLLRHLSDAARHPAHVETGHPVVQSFEPGEDWFWDYVLETPSPDLGSPTPSTTPSPRTSPAPRTGFREDWQKYVN